MKVGLLITNGTLEHPCIKENNDKCSLACPNYCLPNGYTAKEASILGIQSKKFECAVKVKHIK